MRKIFFLLVCSGVLLSCGESDQGGIVNDGMEPLDTNGALVDSTPNQRNSTTDTAKGENRVDIQQRDNAELTRDSARK